MPNNQMKSLTIGSTTYDIVDETSGYIKNYTETDPTVPSWAKQSTKPSYTAVEVGAQPTLVSGTNIKTINNQSLLGSGNIAVQSTLVSGTNIKTINNTSLLGSGNISIEATVTAMTNQEIEDAVDAGWSELIAVSISLTNPKSSSNFGSCIIFGLDTDDPFDSGATQIGTIDSPTGSITVQTNQPYLMVHAQGTSVDITYDTTHILTSGNVSWDTIHWGGGQAIFEITGGGSITIDGIDYDD